MTVKSIPAGHRTVTPYLAIQNAAKALEFYKKAFGAIESCRLMMPDGRLGHAEIRLGDSVIMLSDEFPEYGGQAPHTLGGSPVSIHLYVEDVDAFFKSALAAGAKERKPIMDQFGPTWWHPIHDNSLETQSKHEVGVGRAHSFIRMSACGRYRGLSCATGTYPPVP